MHDFYQESQVVYPKESGHMEGQRRNKDQTCVRPQGQTFRNKRLRDLSETKHLCFLWRGQASHETLCGSLLLQNTAAREIQNTHAS